MIFENALLMMNFALPFEDDLNRLLTSCYKPFERRIKIFVHS